VSRYLDELDEETQEMQRQDRAVARKQLDAARQGARLAAQRAGQSARASLLDILRLPPRGPNDPPRAKASFRVREEQAEEARRLAAQSADVDNTEVAPCSKYEPDEKCVMFISICKVGKATTPRPHSD
jgi:hypothetical protein